MKTEIPLAKIVVVAVLYFVTGKLGLLLAIPPGVATAVWPPSGVAFAAALVWGTPIWPGIWVGSFLVNIGTLFDSSRVESTMVSLAVVTSIGVGSTLQAMLGAFLIRRGLGSTHPFGKVKHITRFVGLLMVSCLVASTLGTTSLVLGGKISWSAYPGTWLTWWLGDLMGVLVVSPLPLVWKTEASVRWERLRVAELLLLFVSSYTMIHLILAKGPFEGTNYLIIPFVVWAALRFGSGITVLAILMVSGIFMWATIQRVGPFALETLNASLLLLQSFIGVSLLTGMVLAAAMAERRQTERYLRVQYEVAQILVKSATLQEAARAILKTICEGLGWAWQYGELWNVDHVAGVLRYAMAWHVPSVRFPEFETLSQKSTFLPGIGLPGRVFKSGQPAWIVDVRKDSNFPRAPAAVKDGLRGACSFPILCNGKVRAVFAFFSVAEEQPNEDVLQFMASVGSQISQFIEHRQTIAEVSEARAWSAAIVDHTFDAIVSKTTEGIITSWNPAAERIFGYTAAEAVGQSMYLIIPEERRAEEADLLARLHRGEHIESFETERLTKDGRKVNISWTISPVKNADGQLIGVSKVGRDITEHNKVEEDRLRAAQIQAIGALAAGIAHDFNNLLATISGNISLARMTLDPSTRSYEQLSSAHRATIHASGLTRQLLTFSKGGKPVMKTISLAPLISEFAEFALQGSNIRCEKQIAADLWPVEADPGQVGQVMTNLLMNARQAMHRGGVIRIVATNIQAASVAGITSPVDAVQISVADQGVGIPKDQLVKIFEPFFTTKITGSGLGLSTAYAIIKQHGGSIMVDSSLGVGTTFSVLLPRSPHIVESHKPSHSWVHKGGRLLCMDDDMALLQMVSEMLLTLGYEVDCVSEGTQAIERYQAALQSNQPYDAVILDLTVRDGLGGKETIDLLRKIDPQVRAIVSSGYSDDPILAQFRQFGFSGSIPKPYTLENLSETLGAVLAS